MSRTTVARCAIDELRPQVWSTARWRKSVYTETTWGMDTRHAV